MIVVSDASPLCYLILIDGVELLPQLYGRVVIPEAVYRELAAMGAPDKVQDWINQHPSWLEIQFVVSELDSGLSQLDAGEREAIALAEQLEASLVLLDEKAARQIAIGRGLKVIGLLGILGISAERGLINFAVMIERLQQTNFGHRHG
jgi:predicted nucleic acid-binding protein